MYFNNFHWHDAVIKNIQINRNNPGIMDTITFDILWPEEIEKVYFVFEDVYWATLNLNFGIVADETILNASEVEENDQDLSNLYFKWKDSLKGIKLKVYNFNLNSSGGKIKIIAKEFRVDKL